MSQEIKQEIILHLQYTTTNKSQEHLINISFFCNFAFSNVK